MPPCGSRVRSVAGVVLGVMLLLTPAARAADTVLIGAVGSASAHLWPLHIGLAKGFFEAADPKVDFVVAQSTAVIQHLAAGSTNIATNAGIVDPIRAIEKGAALAIVRIEIQAPPYALLAKPQIRSIKEFKGKTIIVGVDKAYEFLRNKMLSEPAGKVSRAKLQVVVDALRELGDIQGELPVERQILPGLTQLTE